MGKAGPAKMIGVAALAAVMLLAAMGAWAKGPGRGGPPPVVTVVQVPLVAVNPADEHVGRVEAIQSVDLKARVEGYLKKVAFDEGGVVKAGDLLYQIEKAPYRAKVHEAKAKVALAQAALDKAQRYITRLKTVRAGGVSGTDMDTAQAAVQTARAQLQEAKAGLETAELNLGYTTLRAPISGRIGRTSLTMGNLVGPNSGALARIVQLDPIRVVYSLSENVYVADRMKAKAGGAPVTLVPRLKLADGILYPLAGRTDFTAPQVDPATGTIAVRVIFPNPMAVLLPGQYVTVLVSRRNPRRLPVVPQSAVMEDRNGLFVLVVDKAGVVHRRGIKKGATVGTGWAVESGLSAGETIIVHGLQKAAPGQKVKTLKAKGN